MPLFDIAVIGAGIAGASVAARLAPHRTVCLLEREAQPGYHASGRSAAMFLEGYGNRLVQALNRASRAELEEIGALSPRGVLLVGRAQDRAIFATEAEELGGTTLSVAEAVRHVPILDPEAVTDAAYLEAAQEVDTDRVLQHFLRGLRSAGGTLRANAAVVGLRRAGEVWRVETVQGEIEARTIVNAAGAWADVVADLAGLRPLGITPLRRSMARLPAPEGQDLKGWPMLLGAGERWYAKPDAGAWLVSPADEDPVPPQDAWAEDIVIAEGLARYEEMVTAPVTRLLGTWAGLRSFAPDRTLVLGADPAEPSFVWCAGQGGYGFQTAPAASALLADLILRREPAFPPELVAALSPARFA